jgi:hypothetical protein
MKLKSFMTLTKSRKEADMVIVEIPKRLFSKGREEAPEMSAVRRLQIGEAIRFPCRWSHNLRSHNICGAYNAANSAASREKIKVTVRCREGFVHVIRKPD